MTTFNFATNIIIISFLVYKYNPFWISLKRTFWMKKVTSITLWYRYFNNREGSCSKGILSISLRDKDKWEKWDSEQFHNGNYKKVKDSSH